MQSSSLIRPSFSSIQFFNFSRNYLRVEVVICANSSELSIVLDIYVSVISTIFFSKRSSNLNGGVQLLRPTFASTAFKTSSNFYNFRSTYYLFLIFWFCNYLTFFSSCVSLEYLFLSTFYSFFSIYCWAFVFAWDCMLSLRVLISSEVNRFVEMVLFCLLRVISS